MTNSIACAMKREAWTWYLPSHFVVEKILCPRCEPCTKKRSKVRTVIIFTIMIGLILKFMHHSLKLFSSVNGGWGSWNSWSSYGSCSKTCGYGTKKYKRQRYCNNPAPRNGGRGCYGSSTKYTYKQCHVRTCPGM